MKKPTSFAQSDIPPHVLAKIIDQCPVGVVLTDEGANIVAANHIAVNYLSTRQDGSKSTLAQLGKTDHGSCASPPDNESSGRDSLFRTHSILRLIEGSHSVQTPDSTSRPVVMTTTSEPSFLPQGWKLTYVNDVSQEINTTFQCAEATGHDATRYLAREIAHDLNGRIGTILMALESQERHQPIEEEMRTLLDGSINEIKALADNLRRFVQSRRAELKVFSVAAIAAEVHETALALAAPNATLELKCPATELSLRGDPTEIAQVILKLYLSCIQWLPSSQRFCFEIQSLSISSDASPSSHPSLGPGHYAEICIYGTPDASEVEQAPPPRLDLFFTPPGPNQKVELGLKYCETIIKTYGGLIEPIQEGDDRYGFKLWIPAQPQNESTALSPPPNALKSTPKSILFVDDDPAYARLAKRFLSLPDVKLHVATDAQQALQILEQQSCSLMIADLLLAGTHGLTLIKKAKSLHPNIEIIVVTGLITPDDEAALKSINVTTILNKPIKNQALRSIALAKLASASE